MDILLAVALCIRLQSAQVLQRPDVIGVDVVSSTDRPCKGLLTSPG